MTEYEMGDLLTSTSLAAVDSFSQYLTILVAYMVTSYMAGRKLTKAQSTTVSALFVVAAALSTWSVFTYMSRSIPIADALERINPGVTYGAQPMARNMVAVICMLGILAALKFMWDIRHPKTE